MLLMEILSLEILIDATRRGASVIDTIAGWSSAGNTIVRLR